MAFDDTPTYDSDIAAGDEATANLVSSAYLQFSVAASRPAQGNKGVVHFATDTLVLSYDDGVAWVTLGQTTPSGEIAFFTGACPTGWTEYTAARGRYVVGTPSGGTGEGTVGTALTDLEARAVGQHTHTFTGSALSAHTHDMRYRNNSANATFPGFLTISAAADIYHASTPDTSFGTGSNTSDSAGTPAGTNANSGSVAGTNAPYVQLTACKKD